MGNSFSEPTELEAAIERWKRYDALPDDANPWPIYDGGIHQYLTESEMMLRHFIYEREARLKQEADDALPIDEEFAASVRSDNVETFAYTTIPGLWDITIKTPDPNDSESTLTISGAVRTRGQVRMLLAAAGELKQI